MQDLQLSSSFVIKISEREKLPENHIEIGREREGGGACMCLSTGKDTQFILWSNQKVNIVSKQEKK